MSERKPKKIFRLATPNDIPKIVALEEDVWGETGATAEKIRSRRASSRPVAR